MSKYDFMKFSNATRKIIGRAKLGDALYTILEVDGSICESCSHIEKKSAIKKVYVGRIDQAVDGDRRLSLYRETPATLRSSRYGLSAEFKPVVTAFYGSGQYLALNKDDLLPELEHKLEGEKEINEYRVKKESQDNG